MYYIEKSGEHTILSVHAKWWLHKPHRLCTPGKVEVPAKLWSKNLAPKASCHSKKIFSFHHGQECAHRNRAAMQKV